MSKSVIQGFWHIILVYDFSISIIWFSIGNFKIYLNILFSHEVIYFFISKKCYLLYYIQKGIEKYNFFSVPTEHQPDWFFFVLVLILVYCDGFFYIIFHQMKKKIFNSPNKIKMMNSTFIFKKQFFKKMRTLYNIQK